MEPKTDTPAKFSTSTQIVPFLACGTYWGPLDWESIWATDAEDDRADGYLVCDDFDGGAFKNAVVKEANAVFENERPLEEMGVVSVRATKMLSPREYNFTDDSLDLEVEVDGTFFDRAEAAIFAPENRDRVVKYIEDHWCSRDGFISYMPATKPNGRRGEPGARYDDADLDGLRDVIRGLKDGTNDGYEEYREFGAVLALVWHLAGGSGCDDLTEALVELVRGNHSLGEFCTEIDPEQADGLLKAVPVWGAIKEQELKARVQCGKYAETDVPESCKDAARRWLDAVHKAAEEFRSEIRSAFESWYPTRENGQLGQELEDIAERWGKAVEGGWAEAWK